ncbi:hypothetical protein M9Y09_18510, partial [Clostridioides difficile]
TFPFFIICIVDGGVRRELKQASSYNEIFLFFHFRGRVMPRSRRRPFLSEKQADKHELEDTLWQKRIICISEYKREKSEKIYI